MYVSERNMFHITKDMCLKLQSEDWRFNQRSCYLRLMVNVMKFIVIGWDASLGR
ncbi:MAG: hypothetical protein ACTS53_01595 [Candidatus Hodgkinia cicadicola]